MGYFRERPPNSKVKNRRFFLASFNADPDVLEEVVSMLEEAPADHARPATPSTAIEKRRPLRPL